MKSSCSENYCGIPIILSILSTRTLEGTEG
jgi:hypothetical protein